MSSVGNLIGKVVVGIILLLLLTAVIYPILWMLMTSLKPQWEIFSSPFAFPTSPNLDNYVRAWDVANFGLYFFNSVLISISAIVGLLLMSSMAGFAFGRYRFKGDNPLFLFFLVGLMVAPQSIMISTYQWLSTLHLIDSYIGIIFAYWSWTPLGILILTTAFRNLPKDLEEAARIDGCPEWMIFWRVMLPLVTPGLATVGIFQFVSIWNDFVLPLIVLQSPGKNVIALGVMALKDQFTVDWGLQTAALAIATIPPLVLYYVFQKQFIRGITAGAIKG